MSKRFNSIILMSGGIDSTIAYYYLDKPQPVYFDLGSRYTEKELHYVPYLIDNRKHDLIVNTNLKFLGQQEEDLNAHIPFRNLYLAMTAAAQYADTVYIIGVKDDNMTDKTEEVFKLWSNHLSKLEQREIKILSPFWDKTKVDIVRWFRKNHYNYVEILLSTVSCYTNNDQNYCGRCQACFRKATALFQIGLELPFTNYDIIHYYEDRIGKRIYDYQRENSMRKYINHLRSNIQDDSKQNTLFTC